METLEPLRPEGNRFETTQFYNHTVLTAGLRSALCDTGLIRSKIVHRVPRVFSKKNLIPHRAMVVVGRAYNLSNLARRASSKGRSCPYRRRERGGLPFSQEPIRFCRLFPGCEKEDSGPSTSQLTPGWTRRTRSAGSRPLTNVLLFLRCFRIRPAPSRPIVSECELRVVFCWSKAR